MYQLSGYMYIDNKTIYFETANSSNELCSDFKFAKVLK